MFAYVLILIPFIIITVYTPRIKSLADNQSSKIRALRHDDVLLTSVIVTFVLGILIIVLSSHFNFLALQPKQDPTLLTTDATIIAKILTVSFSFSLFGVQHTAGNYSPSILHFYMKERGIWVTFTIFSLSTILNLVGLLVGPTKIMMFLSLFVTTYSFPLLAYHFYNTYRYASPVRLIEIIERTARRYMYSSGTIINEMRNDFRLAKEETQLQAYEKLIGKRNSFHAQISTYASQIVDLIQKTTSNLDIETANKELMQRLLIFVVLVVMMKKAPFYIYNI